jgi:hypothetical protein
MTKISTPPSLLRTFSDHQRRLDALDRRTGGGAGGGGLTLVAQLDFSNGWFAVSNMVPPYCELRRGSVRVTGWVMRYGSGYLPSLILPGGLPSFAVPSMPMVTMLYWNDAPQIYHRTVPGLVGTDGSLGFLKPIWNPFGNTSITLSAAVWKVDID